MILKKVFTEILFSVCFICSAVYASNCNGATKPQLSLCQEFQLLRDLVPKASMSRLVQSHMGNDIRFRKAVKYMLSSAFKKTTGKLDATATFQSILKEFVRAGVNTADIDSVGKIFDCIIIPVIRDETCHSRSSFHTDNVAKTRSLDTFVQEVVRLIPTDEFINTIEAEVDRNRQFAAFYEVVRDPSFRSKVMQGLTNSDVARPIKTLRHYQIDLPKLVEQAFNNW